MTPHAVLSRLSPCTWRVHVLRGLANAADPATLPAIARYLADPEGVVRAAAAQALRHLPGTEADVLLAARLESEGDASVAEDMVKAVGVRRPSPRS